MRAELSKGMARSSGSGRQAELARVGLGLVGDVGSVALLVERPDHAAGRRCRPRPPRRSAGSAPPPRSPALVSALNVPDELVRSAAAGALGDIGDPRRRHGLGLALDRAPG